MKWSRFYSGSSWESSIFMFLLMHSLLFPKFKHWLEEKRSVCLYSISHLDLVSVWLPFTTRDKHESSGLTICLLSAE